LVRDTFLEFRGNDFLISLSVYVPALLPTVYTF
jgi:hypothetical protein